MNFFFFFFFILMRPTRNWLGINRQLSSHRILFTCWILATEPLPLPPHVCSRQCSWPFMFTHCTMTEDAKLITQRQWRWSLCLESILCLLNFWQWRMPEINKSGVWIWLNIKHEMRCLLMRYWQQGACWANASSPPFSGIYILFQELACITITSSLLLINFPLRFVLLYSVYLLLTVYSIFNLSNFSDLLIFSSRFIIFFYSLVFVLFIKFLSSFVILSLDGFHCRYCYPSKY